MSGDKATVTAKDISRGIPEDSERCPVALSMRRLFGRKVSVTGDGVSVATKTSFQFYRFPRSVTRYIERIDALKKVKPMSFVLQKA